MQGCLSFEMSSPLSLFKFLVFALATSFAFGIASKSLIEMDDVVIFSKSYCPYCKGAKELLKSQNIVFKAYELDQMSNGSELHAELKVSTGQNTVPNIFINGKHVGGFDSVSQLQNEGKLKVMVQSKSSSNPEL